MPQAKLCAQYRVLFLFLALALCLNGQSSKEVTKALEQFLLPSSPDQAYGVCTRMFNGSFATRSVKLAVEGPVSIRNAAASTRVAELRSTYLNSAADIASYGHCMKGAGLSTPPIDWWARLAPVNPKTDYCVNSTELVNLSSLRLYFYCMQRLVLGMKDTELTATDTRIRTLLSPSAQQPWDANVWDMQFVQLIVSGLMSPEGL